MMHSFDYSQISPEKAMKAKDIVLMIKELEIPKDFRRIGELLSIVFFECLPTKLHLIWVESELGDIMTFKDAMAYHFTNLLDEDELLDWDNF